MAIYIGSQKVIPHGISKVYVGPNKVYEKSVAPSYDAVLANNTWAQIKEAIYNGVAPAEWLGQTKLSGSYNKAWQLVDLTTDRYEKVDGTGYTKAVFVLKQQYGGDRSNYYQYWNNTWNSTPFVTACDNLYNNTGYISSDLKSIISECKVKYATSNGSTSAPVTTRDCTVFMPSKSEVNGTWNTNEGSMYEYFTSNANRAREVTNSSYAGAITRTRDQNSGDYYYITSSGGLSTSGRSTYKGLCIAFAI